MPTTPNNNVRPNSLLLIKNMPSTRRNGHSVPAWVLLLCSVIPTLTIIQQVSAGRPEQDNNTSSSNDNASRWHTTSWAHLGPAPAPPAPATTGQGQANKPAPAPPAPAASVGPQANCSHAAGAPYLLARPTDGQLDQSQQVDAILSSVLDRVGPDMRPTSGFKDFADITPPVAQRGWQLMRDHALWATNARIQLIWPLVQQLLVDSNVSLKCLLASGRTAEAARRLDTWAIQCK